MNRLYIDFHVIQTVPPSCVNRDDTNSPKTAVYGGVRRARVSSQSWKRAMRLMFREHFDEVELGVRTKDIIGLVLEQMPEDIQIEKSELSNKIREVINIASAKATKPIFPDLSYVGIKKKLNDSAKERKGAGDPDSQLRLLEELKAIFKDLIPNADMAKDINSIFKLIDAAAKKESDGNNSELRADFEREAQKLLLQSPFIASLIDSTSDVLFFMGKQESINIANLVVNYVKDGLKPTKEQVQEALNCYQKKDGKMSCFAVDVALFGRMVAKAPDLNADASAQVAHSISTHTIENEYDYFTAVDDRSPADNAGAGMIGTVEFNSATLYRYATVAAHELYAQLSNDADALDKAVAEFARAFATSMPTGKQNTFANRTLPDAVLVTLREDQPINLAGAFEKPVRAADGGYRDRSVQVLIDYARSVYADFAGEPTCTFVVGSAPEGVGEKLSLAALYEALPAKVREVVGS
jgi:CRISPR system Cascade subunit CasC